MRGQNFLQKIGKELNTLTLNLKKRLDLNKFMQYNCIIKVVRKFLKDIRVYSKLILKDVFKVCSKVTTDTSVQWLQYRTL